MKYGPIRKLDSAKLMFCSVESTIRDRRQAASHGTIALQAYRQLSLHVAEGLFSPALMDGTFNPDNRPLVPVGRKSFGTAADDHDNCDFGFAKIRPPCDYRTHDNALRQPAC